MIKPALAVVFFVAYLFYSLWVYTGGTETNVKISEPGSAGTATGKQLYQQYNCQSCHQIYGLGGYLGPDLTTAYSDPHRGEQYIRTFLTYGGSRMPRFNFEEKQLESIISYLKYVDSTAAPVKDFNWK